MTASKHSTGVSKKIFKHFSKVKDMLFYLNFRGIILYSDQISPSCKVLYI